MLKTLTRWVRFRNIMRTIGEHKERLLIAQGCYDFTKMVGHESESEVYRKQINTIQNHIDELYKLIQGI